MNEFADEMIPTNSGTFYVFTFMKLSLPLLLYKASVNPQPVYKSQCYTHYGPVV